MNPNPRPQERPPARAAAPLLAPALLLACALAPAAAAQEPLRVLTHESFDVPAHVLEAFEARSGIDVELLAGGDAGEVVNRAVLTAGRPLADVIFGVDQALAARLEGEGVLEPYDGPALERVPEPLRFGDGSLVPVDVGYVNFNYDVAWFEENGVTPPTDLLDLTGPAYRGLTVVQDPASSSPGLALLLATVARFGEEGGAVGADGDPAFDWLDWWAAMRDNDVLVTPGWSDAYYAAFSRYGGDRPIVLSYASSPAAEVIFAEEPLDGAPTANLFCRSCVWRQIEAAGILAGTERREAAEAFLEFLVSEEFQATVAGTMFVYPVVEGAPVPPEFDLYAAVPEDDQVARLDPERIEASQAAWLEAWTRVVQQGREPATVR